MSWVKRTDTPEESKFWSHVQSVAERVRTSEIYANNRLPKDCSHAVMAPICEPAATGFSGPVPSSSVRAAHLRAKRTLQCMAAMAPDELMERQIDVVYGMGSAEPMRDLHAGRNHRIAALKLSVRCCEEIDWEI
jgi:hypothetical protein